MVRCANQSAWFFVGTLSHALYVSQLCSSLQTTHTDIAGVLTAIATAVVAVVRVEAVVARSGRRVGEEEQHLEKLEIGRREIASGARGGLEHLAYSSFAGALALLLESDLASLMHALLVQVRSIAVVATKQMPLAVQLHRADVRAQLAAIHAAQRIVNLQLLLVLLKWIL